MRRRNGARAILRSFIFVASLLFSPLIAHSAPPGIDAFSDGLGVATWWTNPTIPFTALEHWVRIIDYNGISSDGTSHVVQVTYPDATVKTLQYRYHKDSYSAFYELYDNSIPQPINPATYNGTYTYKVTRVDGEEFSETTDDLQVHPVIPLDETTFAPGLPGPQSITAYFDNVYINGSLYDDFSSGFDATKWQSQPAEVTFTDGEAKFEKTWNTSTGNATMYLSSAMAASVHSLKATARITNFSGSSPFTRARVKGSFCHLPEGDVVAYVGLRGNEAVYGVVAEQYDGNHFIDTLLIPPTNLGVVTQGNRYDLSVEWDEVSKLTFRVVGLDDATGYSVSYTVSGTISQANNPYKVIELAAFSTVDTTTPTFSWTEVPEAKYYRVRIYGMNDSTIYTGYTTSPPFVMPPGILKPYGVYKYRIEALQDHQWFEWDNVAVSDQNKTLFFVNTSNEAQAPYIDLASNGALTQNSPYGSEVTDFSLEVHDAQGVPDNIESVKVLFPDGSTGVPLYYNYSITPTRAQYNGSYYGLLQPGTYTFTVTDKDGNNYTTTEDFEPNAIGTPSEASLVPAHNTVVGGTGVTFDWDDVDGAVYYEVQLFDKNLNTLYRLRTTESQYTLPPGILQENQLYKYKINSVRELPEDNFDNFSEMPAFPYNDFFTTPVTGGAALPSLDLVNYGVVVFTAPHPVTGAPTYELDIGIKVTDADGVPENIQKVEVTYPDTITKKLLKYLPSPAFGFNYLYQELFTDLSSIQSGTYKITVYDFDGNHTELTDELGDVATNALPWPTHVMPPKDSYLSNTTPTITWSPVAGALYYRVRILDSWGSDTTVHWSPDLGVTHYTVPAGVLSPHTTYAYRVYAFREPSGSEVDFASTHVSPHSLNYHFTTGDVDTDGDGLSDLKETALGTSATDVDTDDDGLSDGEEDANHNGIVDPGETDPRKADTDGDGIQDGTELGKTTGVPDPDGDGPLLGTNMAVFIPDADPATKTDPLNPDTDGDGVKDGQEDRNANGRVDPGEGNPSVKDQGSFYVIPNKKGGAAIIYLE
jgi:hypothetical protein